MCVNPRQYIYYVAYPPFTHGINIDVLNLAIVLEIMALHGDMKAHTVAICYVNANK